MKRVFIIPILIFASFVVLLYCVLPQVSAQKEAKDNFLEREQDVKDRQAYFNGLKNTLLEVSAYQEILEKIELSMPGEVSLSALIDFFNQKASNNGLILKSVAPIQTVLIGEDSKKSNEIPFQSFSISLSGGVSSFEGFLKDIETSLRLVEVESFSLQQEMADSSSGINIQIKVYY